MQEAVASYVVRGAEKLRQEQQQYQLISVHIRTGVFNPNESRYSNSNSNSISMKLDYPTDDTRLLLKAARTLLQAIWKPGYRYAKAGIMLADFYDRGIAQPDLFSQATVDPKSAQLISVLDQLNLKHRGQLYFASQGISRQWQMNRRYLSPSYTTDWNQIPVVKD